MPLSVFAKTEVKEAPLLLPKSDEMAIIHHNPDMSFLTKLDWSLKGQISDDANYIYFQGTATVNKNTGNVDTNNIETKEMLLKNVIYSADYDKDKSTNSKSPTVSDFKEIKPHVSLIYGNTTINDLANVLMPGPTDKTAKTKFFKGEILNKKDTIPVQLVATTNGKDESQQVGLIKSSMNFEAISKSTNHVGGNAKYDLYADVPVNFGDFTEVASGDTILYGGRDEASKTVFLVQLLPIPQAGIDAMAKNPNTVNAMTFYIASQALNANAAIAQTSKRYAYMVDHYYAEIGVFKGVKNSEAPQDGLVDMITMVSKNNQSNEITLATYITPDLNNGFTTEEQVIRSMLSLHVEPKNT